MRLDLARRYKIQALLVAGFTQRATASAVGISTGGLCKELARNGGRDDYDPEQADIRARKLAKTSHVHEAFGSEIWDAVENLIRDDLSPEQAAGRLKLNGKATPSIPTIYRRIGDDVSFRRHLRHGRKRYRKRGPLKDLRGTAPFRGKVFLPQSPPTAYRQRKNFAWILSLRSRMTVNEKLFCKQSRTFLTVASAFCALP